MSKDNTLYDKTVQKLKNKRSVVFILVAFLVIVAASQFLGGISDIIKFFAPGKTKLKAYISLQQYDLMADSTESPEMLDTIEGDTKDINAISELIAEKVANKISPVHSLEIQLEISETKLNASHELIAYIHPRMASEDDIKQWVPLKKDFDMDKALDLLAISQQDLYFNSQTDSLSISIRDSEGHFARENIEIFKKEDIFSFGMNAKKLHKDITFRPKNSRILCENIEVKEASADAGNIEVSLNAIVKKRLAAYEFLEISPHSRDDLQKKREEIKKMPLGAGKNELIDQYNVDFIVTGNIIIK